MFFKKRKNKSPLAFSKMDILKCPFLKISRYFLFLCLRTLKYIVIKNIKYEEFRNELLLGSPNPNAKSFQTTLP
jgi:hypothetical protein